MELVLPSIFILVVSALFAFAVIPQFGPKSLAFVSLIALVAVSAHHYTTFMNEYRLSTWQQGIQEYSPIVVLTFAIILSLGYLMSLWSFTTTGNNQSSKVANQASTTISEEPTLLDQITTMAEKSLNAVQKGVNTAETATNSFTAAVNRGFNAMLEPTAATAPAPAPLQEKEAVAPPPIPAQREGLPFSPSSL